MQDSTSMARPMTPAAITARAQVLAHEHRLMRAELVGFGRRAGLSQGEVAERMGVSQQAVSKFEAYDADPKLSTLRRYANAVGALLGHLVERDHGQSDALAGDPSAREATPAQPTSRSRSAKTPADPPLWTDRPPGAAA